MSRSRHGDPMIVRRADVFRSPWMTVVEKHVRFEAGSEAHPYYSIRQAAYVGVLAVTPEGRIPLVRQYRPAVEAFTWELPAGTVDGGETPEQAARRELAEETGLQVRTLVDLGTFIPDTGRLGFASHGFLVHTEGESIHAGEAGVEVQLVTAAELLRMMRTLEFRSQLHWAIVAAAMIRAGWKDMQL